jgi:hypothetical protein
VKRAATDTTPRITAARRAEREARDARLATALRANLRRRKEQARARDEAEAAEPPSMEETQEEKR